MAQLVLFSYRASSEPFDLYVGLTSTFTVFKHPRFFLNPLLLVIPNVESVSA